MSELTRHQPQTVALTEKVIVMETLLHPTAAPLAAANRVLTREQYADAYRVGYAKTTRFLMSRGITMDIAEESAQAAWVTGWEHRDRLRNPDRLLSWVNTIALNVYRTQLRRRETGEPPPETPIAPRTSARAIDLHRALATCGRLERETIQSHYLGGYTSVELGRRGGCTAGAVRIRLLRSRRRIRVSLER